MPVAPDFRLGAVAADERIVGRHRAVGPDANDLAQMVGEVLRLLAIGEMVAHGEEQVAVRRLRDATAEVIAARQRAFLAEDHLDVGEARGSFVDETRAGERGASPASRRFGIADIEGLALRVVAVEGDIMQPALALCEHLGDAAERRRKLAIARDETHASGTFGDQHAAVGQESEAPRICEAARHGFDLDRAGRRAGGLRRCRTGEGEQRHGACQCGRSHDGLLMRLGHINGAPLPGFRTTRVSRSNGCTAVPRVTSPQRGEVEFVAKRRTPGEGARVYREVTRPLTPPLSPTGRGSKPSARKVRASIRAGNPLVQIGGTPDHDHPIAIILR